MVLEHCGELSDGTSQYDSRVMLYLNSFYQELIAGGNTFGTDVSEPWVWAKATKPIIFNLETSYESGSVTLTNGSVDGTFSVAPALSLEGYYLKLLDFEDYFVIKKHVAGETSFQLDLAYFEASGSYNFTACPLEYDLYDDNIIVTNFNNKLDFSNSSGTFVATLTNGVYDNPADFATMVAARLLAAGAVSPTCTYNSLTRKFTLGHGGPSFNILGATGVNYELTGWGLLGLDPYDHTGALSYESENVLNSIQRLIMPATIYRNITPRFLAPEDSGKIYALDANTMQWKYPLTQMYPYVPDRFAIVQYRKNGTMRVRFNTYPRFKMRVEFEYIPAPSDLYDNNASIPLIPRPYHEYLVYAAAYRLMLDKSDNRAESFASLAKAKLQALINDNRSNKELTNRTFGRLLPRAITNRPWRVIP